MAYAILQFPKNKRASRSTVFEQALKVESEAREVVAAVADLETDARVCEEAWDVIYAAEGILRKYPPDVVKAAAAFVIEKAKRRGDI